MNDEDPRPSIELVWEEIEKLRMHIRQQTATEARGADQRLEAFALLRTYAVSNDRLTEALLLARQHFDEQAADSDRREREWNHTLKTIGEAHVKVLIDIAKEIESLKNAIDLTKQLDAIDDKAKLAAEESKNAAASSQKSAAAAADVGTTIKAIENTAMRAIEDVRDHSGKHALLIAEAQETAEEKKDSGYVRLGRAFFKGFWHAPMRSQVALFFILALLGALFVMARALEKSAEQAKSAAEERAAPPPKLPESKP